MEDCNEPKGKKIKGPDRKDIVWSKQFVVPTSKEEMNKMYKGFMPGNTNKATKLAVKVFEQWRVHRNEWLTIMASPLSVKHELVLCTPAVGTLRPASGILRTCWNVQKSASSYTGSHSLLQRHIKRKASPTLLWHCLIALLMQMSYKLVNLGLPLC